VIVPTAFWWTGDTIVIATAVKSAKVTTIRKHSSVALCVDKPGMPPRSLLIRGAATVDIVDGVPDEYVAGSRRQIAGAFRQRSKAATFGRYISPVAPATVMSGGRDTQNTWNRGASSGNRSSRPAIRHPPLTRGTARTLRTDTPPQDGALTRRWDA
jgi:hypothetical protein